MRAARALGSEKTTEGGRPGRWIAAAATVFIVATVIALTQPPAKNPYELRNLFQKVCYPIERNAFNRLPLVTADLNGVCARVRDGKIEVWAVGTGGIILYSADAGETWTRLGVSSLPAALPTNSKRERRPSAVPENSAPKDDVNPGRKLAPNGRGEEKSGLTPDGSAAVISTLLDAAPAPNNSGPSSINSARGTSTRSGFEKSQAETDASPLPSAANSSLSATNPSNASVSLEYELNAVSFVGNFGCIVGANMTVLLSSDNGKTWRKRDRLWPTSEHVHSVVGEDGAYDSESLPGPHFVFVMTSGYWWVLVPAPQSGMTWRAMQTGPRLEPPSAFVALSKDFNVTNDGRLFFNNRFESGNWTPIASSGSRVSCVTQLDEAWAGTHDGDIYRVSTAGLGARLYHPPSTQPLNAMGSVRKNDRASVIAVGDEGVAIWSKDGRSFRLAASTGRAHANLRSVSLADPQHAFAVGEHGTILASDDGGDTWRPLTARWFDEPVLASVRDQLSSADSEDQVKEIVKAYPSRRYPAPLYFLTWPVALGLLVKGVSERRKPAVAVKETIADRGVSDSPLEPGDFDALGVGEVAQAISRFLRNVNTRPPLTLGITGAWGSGKSSMMQLLKADLERFGLRPVWFNAWHYQKEEHILAALLERIRTEAVPRWWTWAGWEFRWNLFWIRFSRYWPVMLIMAAISFGCAGYFLADPATRIASAEKLLSLGSTSPPSKVDAAKPEVSSGIELIQEAIPVLALPPAVAALVLLLLRFLTAFSARPAALMTSLGKAFSVRQIEVQATVRKQFADEFDDVTKALRRYNLVILIDDLDRCRPDSVLEVLEAVNFLTSSGECFVIMGMNRLIVERCIGWGFKDVAQEIDVDELPDAAPLEVPSREAMGKNKGDAALDQGKGVMCRMPLPSDAERNARLIRRRFGKRYLEKLVQMFVPVPTPNIEKAKRLLEAKEDSTLGGQQRRLQKTLSAIAIPSAIAACLVVPFVLGFLWTSPSQTNHAFAGGGTNDSGAASLDRSDGNPKGTSPATSQAANPEQLEPPTKGVFAQNGPVSGVTPAAIFPGAVLLSLGLVWLLLTKVPPTTHDSPAFTKALLEWQPLIFDPQQSTPRSAKRFLNRVRYLAMRQRVRGEDELTAWERLMVLLKLQTAPLVEKNDESIPESELVAVAAVDEFARNQDLPFERDRLVENMKHRIGLEETAAKLRDEWKEMAKYYKDYLDAAGELQAGEQQQAPRDLNPGQ